VTAAYIKSNFSGKSCQGVPGAVMPYCLEMRLASDGVTFFIFSPQQLSTPSPLPSLNTATKA
jgi:hypothetical protein